MCKFKKENLKYRVTFITIIEESLVPVDSVCHDVVKVISCDESIIVQICLDEHLLDFLVSQVLAQILSNLFQFEDCNFSLNL